MDAKLASSGPPGPLVDGLSDTMKRLLLLLLPLSLVACSTSRITSYVTPYRIDVRQGNMVTQEMVAQLKPGQTKEQVRFILGTPLVADMFHADRWDYFYRFEPGSGRANSEQRHFIVHFADGKLARIEGDVVANQTAQTPQETQPKPASRVIEIGPASEAAR